MKKYLPIFLAAILPGIVMFGCILLLLTNTVSITNNGFAVDADQILYLGKDAKIVVIDNGQVVREISAKTSRGYRFTVVEGNTILLSNGSTVYTMDLEGNVLTKSTDEQSKLYNELQFQSKFTDVRGDTYTLSRPWGRLRITKDDTLIYQAPLLDSIVVIAMVLSGVVAAILGLFAAAIYHRQKAAEK